jgi:hypothetical protein
MSRAKPGRAKRSRADWRRWETTLTSDVPAGPDGQPAHPAGSTIVAVTAVHIPDVGGVSFPVPRPSSLLFDAASTHVKRATRLRAQAVKQTQARQWVQPGMERSFTNEPLVMDFFREAMAGVICVHAAFDNFANELMPSDFVYDADGERRTRTQLEESSGIELRLSRVAAAATGRPNLRTADERLWDRLMALKDLRDDISHAKAEQAYSPGDPHGSVFARIFNAPLAQHLDDFEAVKAHYTASPPSRRPIDANDGGEPADTLGP